MLLGLFRKVLTISQVYDLAQRRLLHTLAGHTAPVHAVQFDSQKVGVPGSGLLER